MQIKYKDTNDYVRPDQVFVFAQDESVVCQNNKEIVMALAPGVRGVELDYPYVVSFAGTESWEVVVPEISDSKHIDEAVFSYILHVVKVFAN